MCLTITEPQIFALAFFLLGLIILLGILIAGAVFGLAFLGAVSETVEENNNKHP